jgi:hypothetical protein
MNREMLENVFVTALEGGSNYWYLIAGNTRNEIRKAVPKSTDPYFATAMLTAILDHGVAVEVRDAENPEDILGTLTVASMEERLHALDMSLDYRWALEAEEEGTGDANSSDIVFQYLVIGEVWFS